MKARLMGIALLVSAVADAQVTSQQLAEALAREAFAGEVPIPTFRGGSLGLGPTAEPTAAAITPQLRVGQQLNADLLARLGRIQLSPTTSLDVLGEHAEFSVPTAAVILDQPDSIPDPALQGVGVQQLGGRFTFFLPTYSSSDARRVSTCITTRHTPGLATPDEKKACGELGVDMDASPTDENDLTAFAKWEVRRQSGLRGMAGLRLLYQQQNLDVATAAPGIAGELGAQYMNGGASGFASVSVLYMDRSDAVVGNVNLSHQNVVEGRASFGVRYRWSAITSAGQHHPTLGAYGTLSANAWRNRFSGENERALQFEGSLYFAGHATGAFSGLIAIGVLRAYDPAEPVRFMLTLSPTFNAVPAKDG